MSTLDPKTPVMPGALTTWEREVVTATEAVERAQTRLAFAKEYLGELKAQRQTQEKT